MPLVGFKRTIPASEGPQTYALDRAAIGTGTERDEIKGDDLDGHCAM